MYVLDLFSGIGGFSLGLERAGMKTVAFCEIDPYCRKVLTRHWPGVKIHTDIKQLDGACYHGAIDLICGGYPCQPFSNAGKQRGEEDPRHLWPEMHRIIREVRPRWIVAENVRGHVSLGFDTVAAQLEDDRFTVWPFLVPACAVDAPHKRERLWIVANASGGRCSGAEEREVEQSRRTEAERSSEAMAHATGQRGEGLRAAGEFQPPALAGEALSTCPRAGEGASHWSVEPAVGRLANGVPNRMDRLRAAGNAVVPQIPELIGRAIIAYEQQLAMAA